jgi:tetratricopeptide (TPR) repeat protein
MGDTSYGIWAQSCPHADIIADTIRNSPDESQTGDIGIYLYNSTGTDLDNCVLSGAALSEVDCYNSGPEMYGTFLENGARNGMRLYSNSQPIMTTQNGGENRIADNDSSEIYIYGYKWPYMKNGHNDIADADDPSQPSSMGEYLIAADFDENELYTANVDSNWWYAGEVLDDTSEVHAHLYPANTGDYRIWVVAIDGASNTGYSTSGIIVLTPEELFLEAVELENQGQYQQAYNAFEDLIDDYPGDPVAIAAGQHLFSCAMALGTSMSTLEIYYSNLAQNAACDDFERNWLNMASYCQVENGDFNDAISYYESIINSAASSFTDSIYAEIDAGAAYMRAQIQSGQLYSSGVRTLFGSMAHLCPNSHPEYEAKVKNLLNLLSGDVGPDAGKPALPTKFALHQNYPNPFNPATSILYDLPEMADITLKIYNIMGRHVATLVDKKETAGYKRIIWKGTNRYGGELSSGLYIMQLIAEREGGEKFIQEKKMLLIK